MAETVEQSIEYQRAMDALDAIQENPRFSNLEQRAWKYLSQIVYEVENYSQHEIHSMTWDFSWAHTYERIEYRSCWSSDPEGRENEDGAWHVSDGGVEFRITLDTLRITQSFNGYHLVEIVGELDGYGDCDFCELRYRDDYDDYEGKLQLLELDAIRGGDLLKAGRDVSTHDRRCLEDYCGWLA